VCAVLFLFLLPMLLFLMLLFLMLLLLILLLLLPLLLLLLLLLQGLDDRPLEWRLEEGGEIVRLAINGSDGPQEVKPQSVARVERSLV